jgi:hypothetical protein
MTDSQVSHVLLTIHPRQHYCKCAEVQLPSGEHTVSESTYVIKQRNVALTDNQTLSPGYIRTAMTDQLLTENPDLEREWLSGSMLHRLSTPDEFRGPVLFLLSKASSFMTGADLLIDGGHTAY